MNDVSSPGLWSELRDRQGRFDEALALLDEAEREAVTVVDRAELHRRAGALDRAHAIIDEVLEQQPR